MSAQRRKSVVSHGTDPAYERHIDRELQKALRIREGRKKEPKSWVIDPLALIEVATFKEKPTSMSFELLKRMATRDSIICAIINTRINQVSRFAYPVYTRDDKVGFRIRYREVLREMTPAERKEAQRIERFLETCGDPKFVDPLRDDFSSFLKKIVRDRLTYDAIAVELVTNMRGDLIAFYPVDASTIRIALKHTDNEGHLSGSDLYYVQYIQGKEVTSFTPEELGYGVFYPRSDIKSFGYGFSELEQLITIVTAHLWAEEYNRRFFCLAGETLVTTDRGKIPIRDLVGEEFLVWNGFDYRRATAYYTRVKPVVETVLSCGARIRTSPDHRFLTIRNGESEWVKQKDLRPGDVVLVDAELETDEEDLIPGALFEYVNAVVRLHPDHKGVSLPFPLPRATCIEVFKELRLPIPWYLQYRLSTVVRKDEVPRGEEDMYDVEVFDHDHIFLANGIAVHNSQGSLPKGILNFKGANLSKEKLAAFRRQWQAQVAGIVGAWKMPIVSTPGDIQFIPLHLNNKDMEFSHWLDYLVNIICAIFAVDPAEINFPSRGGASSSRESALFDNSYESKLRQSRDKGLYPLLDFIAHFINKHIVWKINPDFEFVFDGLDRKLGLERLHIQEKEVTLFKTINEIRREEDLEPIPGGDIILNPTYVSFVLQKEEKDFSERMQELTLREKVLDLKAKLLDVALREAQFQVTSGVTLTKEEKSSLDRFLEEVFKVDIPLLDAQEKEVLSHVREERLSQENRESAFQSDNAGAH